MDLEANVGQDDRSSNELGGRHRFCSQGNLMTMRDSAAEYRGPIAGRRFRFRISLRGLFVVTALIATATAMTVIYLRQQKPWVEVVGKDLLRTNASSRTIASARDNVIHNHQNWILSSNGKRSDPTYQGSGRSWKTGPSPQEIRLEVSRGKTQITDKEGRLLSIETISISDQPTLIFLEHNGTQGTEELLNELLRALKDRGVSVRPSRW
jgi:hypothetical protein